MARAAVKLGARANFATNALLAFMERIALFVIATTAPARTEYREPEYVIARTIGQGMLAMNVMSEVMVPIARRVHVKRGAATKA